MTAASLTWIWASGLHWVRRLWRQFLSTVDYKKALGNGQGLSIMFSAEAAHGAMPAWMTPTCTQRSPPSKTVTSVLMPMTRSNPVLRPHTRQIRLPPAQCKGREPYRHRSFFFFATTLHYSAASVHDISQCVPPYRDCFGWAKAKRAMGSQFSRGGHLLLLSSPDRRPAPAPQARMVKWPTQSLDKSNKTRPGEGGS